MYPLRRQLGKTSWSGRAAWINEGTDVGSLTKRRRQTSRRVAEKGCKVFICIGQWDLEGSTTGSSFHVLVDFANDVSGRVVVTGPESLGRLGEIGPAHVSAHAFVTANFSRREPHDLGKMRGLGVSARVGIFLVGPSHPTSDDLLNGLLACGHVFTKWVVLGVLPYASVCQSLRGRDQLRIPFEGTS